MYFLVTDAPAKRRRGGVRSKVPGGQNPGAPGFHGNWDTISLSAEAARIEHDGPSSANPTVCNGEQDLQHGPHLSISRLALQSLRMLHSTFIVWARGIENQLIFRHQPKTVQLIDLAIRRKTQRLW